MPRPLSTTGPLNREKSRWEWQPSQSARLYRYFPRASLAGVIATFISDGGAVAGLRK